MAKGLGSGFPIGAIMAHRDVMGKWVPGAHASTFGGNPMACAVGNATIDVLFNEGGMQNAAELGDYALERLTKFMTDHPSVKRVEGKGLMIGVEFVGPDGAESADFRNRVVDECFLNGVLTLGAGSSTLRVAPPLVITKDEFAYGLDVLERSIAKLEESVWEGMKA
jgi:4-aminobutyrate aminotransferase